MSKFQILFERDFRILLVTPGRRMSAVVSCGPSRRRQANAGFRAGFTEAWRSQRVWISSQDVRRGLALKYIGDAGLSVNEIAYLLHFSDATVFARAFKRWTGESPLHYRRQAFILA